MNVELEEVIDITRGELPFLRFLLRDLREEGEIKELFASLPRLSALRLICKELSLARDSEAMIRACTEKARLLIFQETVTSKGYKPWLFMAHGFWKPNTRITRYKKLWKEIEQRYGIDIFRYSVEVEIASPDGLRYATVTELFPENFFVGATILRKNADSILLLTQRQDIETRGEVKVLFDAAYLKADQSYDSSVSWARFVAQRCLLGEIVVSAGGSWDEQAYYWEFYGLPENLRLLTQEVP
jgi:hypothetical protein